MNPKVRKILSMALCLSMILTMVLSYVPMTAHAANHYDDATKLDFKITNLVMVVDGATYEKGEDGSAFNDEKLTKLGDGKFRYTYKAALSTKLGYDDPYGGTVWSDVITVNFDGVDCDTNYEKIVPQSYSYADYTWTWNLVISKYKGHVYGSWSDNNDGTHSRTCNIDSTHKETADHNFAAATCSAPQTCTGCGATTGEAVANAHGWNAATCVLPKTCKHCGLTEGDVLGHEMVAASFGKPAACKRCGATDINIVVLENALINTNVNLPTKAIKSDNSGYYDVTWSVVSAGATNAAINGNTLKATNSGTATIRATTEIGYKDYVVSFKGSETIDISLGSITVSKKNDKQLNVSYAGFEGGSKDYYIGEPIVITGSTTTNSICVQSGVAYIHLDDVNISMSEGKACIHIISGAEADITLIGDNNLSGYATYGAIYVPKGAKLTVSGSGTLEATSPGRSAAIGGGTNGTSGERDAGTIIINGGTIIARNTATASNIAGGGAGIGGAYEGDGGTIVVNGGCVTSYGGAHAAGIGGGREGEGGNVTINGGTVVANGIYVDKYTIGAGIGAGNYATGGMVTINGGNVKAVPGSSSVAAIKATLKNGNGGSVELKTISLDGAANETAVTEIAGVDYGINDVISLDTNKLYFYLPAGETISSLTAGGLLYDCTADNTTFYSTHNWDGGSNCSDRALCSRCGTLDEPNTTNHNTAISFDENGFCVNGCYEPAVDSNNDGYVEIDKPGKLFWFAQQVNSGNTGLNGILTADINLGNREWTPIGAADAKFTGAFDGNGKSITGFKITATAAGVYGLFGYIQNATVKNFSIDGSVTVNQPEKMDFYFGVVGSAHADAGKNVIIDDVISDIDVTVLDSNMKNSVAGIVGTASAALGTGGSWDGWGRVYVRKCAYTGSINMGNATVDCGGGIIGYVGYNIAAYIENNLYAGSFTGPGGQVGGIVGYNNGKNMYVVNCLSIGALNLTDSYFVGAIGGRYINQLNDKVDSVVKNNYYTGDLPAFSNNPDATNDLVDLGNFDGGNALNVTTEQVKSGEIAIRLGSAWGQTMGSQEHPVPNGQKVYQVSHCGKTVYSNTNSSWDHAYDSEGFCTKTEGETHYQPAQLVDGYYQITNPGNLYWFAQFVNDGNYNANAVLTTNLDLGGREWYTICSTDLYYQTTAYSNAVYTGTFDGANHVISNYVVKGTTGVKCSVGLFGTAYGATIKNLGVDNMTFQLNGATDVRAAAIVGQMLDGTLVENCYVINSDLTPGQFIVGGVAACNYAGTIRNCYTYNVKISANERCGNLVSDIRGDIDKNDRPGAVINCYTDAAWVTGSQKSESKPLVNCQDGVAASRFASGEIAYLLSQGENGGVWGQTIGSEDLPVLDGAKVYELYDCGGSVVGYSNTDSGVSHSYGEPTFAWSADYSACRAVFTCQLDATHTGTVDCTVSVDSTDPSKTVYTATVTVNGKTYTDVKEIPNEVISVEITWTAMEFTYTDGEWQPESHSYADGKWTPDAEDGGVITVKNTGNKDVTVTFGYTKTVDEVEGGFADENETAITSPVALAAGEEKKIKLVLSGKPSSTLENANLGSVTVTITLPEKEES